MRCNNLLSELPATHGSFESFFMDAMPDRTATVGNRAQLCPLASYPHFSEHRRSYRTVVHFRAMALIGLRRPENAQGDFFVDSTCIDCDLCRQIAPETFACVGEQAAVQIQPRSAEAEYSALRALVTCPTASIGTRIRHNVQAAVDSFPDLIDDSVYFCGFASEASYGASSYLILHPHGNILVDSPRFARPLAKRIARYGGIRFMFLTHRDDVADHRAWAREFQAERIMHAGDIGRSHFGIEQVLSGDQAVELGDDLLAIPTPGHTPGHMVLLYKNRYLFAGDHLRWSDEFRTLVASREVCWFSWEKQIRSVQRLIQYEFEWVLPGHGRRAHAGADSMKNFLKDCVRSMRSRDIAGQNPSTSS